MGLFTNYSNIIAYVVATAFGAVFIKIGFGSVSPLLITFTTFAICWAVFLVANAGRLATLPRILEREKRRVLLLNIYTLGSWLGAFTSIKLLNGSIELVLFMSVMPVASTVLSAQWARTMAIDRILLSTIAIVSMFIVFLHPELTAYSLERKVFGIAVGLGAGTVGALYIVASGRLQKQCGLSATDLICIRMPLLIVTTLALSFQELVSAISIDFLGRALIVSATAVIIPVYTLQKSIANIGAVRTAALMPLVPVVAFLLEWGGYVPVTLTVAVAIVLQAVAIMVASYRLASAKAREAAAEPATTIPSAGLVQARNA